MTGENQTIYETNRKLFYEWSIQLFLNGELSQQEEFQLQTLTASGQTDGGLAPRDARILLPKCNGTDAVSREDAGRRTGKPLAETSAPGMTVTPNPAHNTLTVGFGTDEPGVVTVTDLTGRMLLNVSKASGQQQVQINTGGLPNGIYLVSCRAASGHAGNQKVAVQH